MSRHVGRSSRAGCLFLALVLSPLVPANGQSIAELEARVHALQERARIVQARADSITTADHARWSSSLDTVRAGALVVLSTRDLTADTREAAALARSNLERRFGEGVHTLLDGRTFLVIHEVLLDGSDNVRWHAAFPNQVVAPDVDRIQGLAMNLMVSVYQDLWQRLDPPMQEWLSTPLMPTLEGNAITARTYVAVVTSDSPLARACVAGNLAACAGSLGLDHPSDPAARWYSPGVRRALVGRISQDFESLSDRTEIARCLEQQSDSSCSSFLRVNRSLVPAPLSGTVRGTYLLTALRLGGPDALTRLLRTSSGTVSERLEQAANARTDEVLRAWRDAVVGAKPRGTQLSLAMGCSSVVWMAGLLTMALRSSRWR